MAFSARAVANYFVDKARSEGRSLDPMQIQKLVYYAHGWHLALTGRPLIREKVEAWAYGPVISELFQVFKRWGSGPIHDPAPAPSSWKLTVLGGQPASLDREATNDEELIEAKRVLDRVWEVYGRFSAIKLSEMTHQSDSPWSVARRAHPGEQNVEIPIASMQKFFADRLARERNVHAR
jgi:uncharacterized phage-associated protein